jgi:hypothetical protein
MNSAKIAAQLVALCRQGKLVEAIEALYADDAVSIEAADYQGLGRETHGKSAILEKNAAWLRDNEVNGFPVEGPYFSPEHIAILFTFDFTRRASGERLKFAAAALYTMPSGKVVREEFLYSPV